MNLYQRNYLDGLTEEERIEYEAVREKEKAGKPMNIRKNLYHEYSFAARNCLSLFPNNHIDVFDLIPRDVIVEKNNEFLQLVSAEVSNERAVLKFINKTPAYHIIGSVLRGCQYRFGHHSAFLFPEFPLGTSYKVDYLLIGKNSGGYEFVYIELENPIDKIPEKVTMQDGELGGIFRKGISQVKDWRRWLSENYISESVFSKLTISPIYAIIRHKEVKIWDTQRI